MVQLEKAFTLRIIILLALIAISFVSAETCLDAYCECNGNRMTCDGQGDNLEKIFNVTEPDIEVKYQYIIIKNAFIGILYQYQMERVSWWLSSESALEKAITLETCQIQEITDVTFAVFRHRHLTSLGLQNNRLQKLTGIVLAPLGTLRYLSLDNNQIESLHPQSFSNLTNLESVSIQNNLISHVPEGLFVKTKLIHLSLFANRLCEFSTSVLPPVSRMWKLELASNHIHTLDLQGGKCFSDRFILAMERNRLRSFDFASLNYLSDPGDNDRRWEFDLKDNYITSVAFSRHCPPPSATYTKLIVFYIHLEQNYLPTNFLPAAAFLCQGNTLSPSLEGVLTLGISGNCFCHENNRTVNKFKVLVNVEASQCKDPGFCADPDNIEYPETHCPDPTSSTAITTSTTQRATSTTQRATSPTRRATSPTHRTTSTTQSTTSVTTRPTSPTSSPTTSPTTPTTPRETATIPTTTSSTISQTTSIIISQATSSTTSQATSSSTSITTAATPEDKTSVTAATAGGSATTSSSMSVSAKNVGNRTGGVTISSTTIEATEALTERTDNLIMIIVGTIGGALLLVIIVIVIVFCCRSCKGSPKSLLSRLKRGSTRHEPNFDTLDTVIAHTLEKQEALQKEEAATGASPPLQDDPDENYDTLYESEMSFDTVSGPDYAEGYVYLSPDDKPKPPPLPSRDRETMATMLYKGLKQFKKQKSGELNIPADIPAGATEGASNGHSSQGGSQGVFNPADVTSGQQTTPYDNQGRDQTHNEPGTSDPRQVSSHDNETGNRGPDTQTPSYENHEPTGASVENATFDHHTVTLPRTKAKKKSRDKKSRHSDKSAAREGGRQKRQARSPPGKLDGDHGTAETSFVSPPHSPTSDATFQAFPPQPPPTKERRRRRSGERKKQEGKNGKKQVTFSPISEWIHQPGSVF